MEKIRPLDDSKTQRKTPKLTPMVRLETAPTVRGCQLSESVGIRRSLLHSQKESRAQLAPTGRGQISIDKNTPLCIIRTNMAHGIFITGTGTEIGKTVIAGGWRHPSNNPGQTSA